MSSELERRLEGMLAEAPEPDPGAGEKALHRALQAVQPAPHSRRGLRTVVVAFAAVLVLLAIAAGSLAAAGGLHVSFGAKKKPAPAETQLVLPKGANGIAAIVDGRLSVVIKGGFRLQTRASAAALSPHALYVAAGIGRSLVALAPSGRRAWSHPVGGKVVAIAWAPDGLEIAYIVRSGNRLALHLIYGNGRTDTTIDRSVRAVRPSWRSDSLAVAYVGAGGKLVVYDLGHELHTVSATASPVTHLSFAPTGKALAFATPDSALVGAKRVASGPVDALGWFRGRLVAATPGHPAGSVVVAITPHTVVVRRGRTVLAGHTTLLTVPRNATVSDLQLG
jgi:hypothetical protein